MFHFCICPALHWLHFIVFSFLDIVLFLWIEVDMILWLDSRQLICSFNVFTSRYVASENECWLLCAELTCCQCECCDQFLTSATKSTVSPVNKNFIGGCCHECSQASSAHTIPHVSNAFYNIYVIAPAICFITAERTVGQIAILWEWLWHVLFTKAVVPC